MLERNLVATNALEKGILQRIAPAISKQMSSVAGFVPWTSTGDPCEDAWHGVFCNANGNIIGIDFENWYNGGGLDGPCDGFCCTGNKLDGKEDFPFLLLYM